jgi:hypothetical protein
MMASLVLLFFDLGIEYWDLLHKTVRVASAKARELLDAGSEKDSPASAAGLFTGVG